LDDISSKNILTNIGYHGSINSGFLVFDKTSTYVLEFTDEDLIKGNPFDFFYHFFKAQQESENEYLYSPITLGYSAIKNYEGLDEETVSVLKTIEKQIERLKESGQMLLALPILKQIVESQYAYLDVNSISAIEVDANHNIILPLFNNLAVQMSHLTKVVYLLFYNEPNGINIKELYQYEHQIKKLYVQVSNQMNHDKMMKSIDDLIQPNSKAIYTHISRVKSAFYKIMDENFACNYIISSDGHGSNLKYIKLVKPPLAPNDGVVKEAIF